MDSYVPVASLLTDHFEGLRQVFEYATGRPPSKPEFKQRKIAEEGMHPMMLGFLFAFWAAPHMTVGHVLLASLMTSYILAGIYFEERDWRANTARHIVTIRNGLRKLLPMVQVRRAAKSALRPESL